MACIYEAMKEILSPPQNSEAIQQKILPDDRAKKKRKRKNMILQNGVLCFMKGDMKFEEQAGKQKKKC